MFGGLVQSLITSDDAINLINDNSKPKKHTYEYRYINTHHKTHNSSVGIEDIKATSNSKLFCSDDFGPLQFLEALFKGQLQVLIIMACRTIPIIAFHRV